MSSSFRDGVDAFSSGGPFVGFADEDFDAYEKKKWSSNAYTLARRKAKDKVLALAHAIREELSDQLGTRELHGSDEAPTVANGKKVEAQWAFFIRDGDVRTKIKPLIETTNLAAGDLFDIALQHQHACLEIRLDVSGVSVGFCIANKARIDRDNAAARLADPEQRRAFLELCRQLPEGTQLQVGEEKIAAAELDEGRLEAFAKRLGEKEERFSLEKRTDRDDNLVRGRGFIQEAASELRAFAGVDEFLAWRDDNDFANLKSALAETEKARNKATSERFKKGDRVTILSGFFAGQGGFVVEIDADSGKAKIAIGPASLTAELKDLKPA